MEGVAGEVFKVACTDSRNHGRGNAGEGRFLVGGCGPATPLFRYPFPPVVLLQRELFGLTWPTRLHASGPRSSQAGFRSPGHHRKSRTPCVQVAVKLLHEAGDGGAIRAEALLTGSTVFQALRHVRSGPTKLSA